MNIQLFLFAVISTGTLTVEGYHWRTWNGTVPHDAVVGAVDSRGVSYIAKAWIPKHGVFVGQVFAGQTEIPVSYSTSSFLVQYSNTIEVLCSENNDVAWIGSNSTNTADILEKQSVNAVLGGLASESDQLHNIYIGKLVEKNTYVYIGSVYADYYLYWVNENLQGRYSSLDYNVLVHPSSSTN